MNFSLLHPDAKALIFDCDGTLVDSMALHWQAWHETFETFGETCPQSFLEPLAGIPTDGIVATYNKAFGKAIPVPEFSRRKEERVFLLLDSVKPIEKVVAVAKAAFGKMPMGVVSGGIRRDVEKTLGATGIRGLFSVVITADDGLPPKPSPQIFLTAAARLGCNDPRFCQVFEDAEPGLAGARAAGMIATDVRPHIFSQTAVFTSSSNING